MGIPSIGNRGRLPGMAMRRSARDGTPRGIQGKRPRKEGRASTELPIRPQRLIATDPRIHTIGLVLGGLSAAIFATITGEATVASVLRLLGVVLTVATLWRVVLPASYGGFVQDSTDTAIGLLGIAIGVWLVYFGMRAAW